MPGHSEFLGLRARRRGKLASALLVMVCTLIWVSQAFAACCQPLRLSAPLTPGAHQALNTSLAFSGFEYHDSNLCPAVIEENAAPTRIPFLAAGNNPAFAALPHNGRSTAGAENYRPGRENGLVYPEPLGRIYLRLKRFLI